MENQKENQDLTNEIKARKSLNTKQYRAFLIYCDTLQKSTLKKIEDARIKLDLASKQNANNRQVMKQIRLSKIQLKQDTYETKKKINNIGVCLDALSQFEGLNNVSYKLTEEFIIEEGKRYEPKNDDRPKDDN